MKKKGVSRRDVVPRRGMVCEGKRRYGDKGQALRDLHWIQTFGVDHGTAKPVRAYYCDPEDGGCSGHHLTSKETA